MGTHALMRAAAIIICVEYLMVFISRFAYGLHRPYYRKVYWLSLPFTLGLFITTGWLVVFGDSEGRLAWALVLQIFWLPIVAIFPSVRALGTWDVERPKPFP